MPGGAGHVVLVRALLRLGDQPRLNLILRRALSIALITCSVHTRLRMMQETPKDPYDSSSHSAFEPRGTALRDR